jgi:hypothetical protein
MNEKTLFLNFDSMKVSIAIIAFMVVAFISCDKKAKYSPIPEISAMRTYPTSIKAGYSFDTVFIAFRFTDGDGDLGNTLSSGKYDIFLYDSRNDSLAISYYFPEVPDALVSSQGLSGTCFITMPAAYIHRRENHKVLDTLHYNIYIMDRADHKSNTLSTSDIYLK